MCAETANSHPSPTMRTKTRQYHSMLDSDYNRVNVFLRFLPIFFYMPADRGVTLST